MLDLFATTTTKALNGIKWAQLSSGDCQLAFTSLSSGIIFTTGIDGRLVFISTKLAIFLALFACLSNICASDDSHMQLLKSLYPERTSVRVEFPTPIGSEKI